MYTRETNIDKNPTRQVDSGDYIKIIIKPLLSSSFIIVIIIIVIISSSILFIIIIINTIIIIMIVIISHATGGLVNVTQFPSFTRTVKDVYNIAGEDIACLPQRKQNQNAVVGAHRGFKQVLNWN